MNIKTAVRPVYATLIFALAGVGSPTARAANDWTGSIRCEILVQTTGYSHQETQTWTLAGSPPTVQGSNNVHAATWSVTGQGW